MNWKLFRVSPILFISYSRDDSTLAGIINSALIAEGYKTFFDTESIHVGDIFPEKIIKSLRKCDGCLIIVSPTSIKSEWCKLEAYYANFLNKPLIPIKIGNKNYETDSPLHNIQKNINYSVINDIENVDIVIDIIKKRLTETKRNAKLRILINILMILGIATLIIGFFTFGIEEINKINHNNEKKEFLEKIITSNKIYRKREIDKAKENFADDQSLIAQLHLQESDPGLSDIAKINSAIMSSALLSSFNLFERRAFKNIDWSISKLENNNFSNSVFQSGNISQVNFRNVNFLDIYFKGVTPTEQGIKLSMDSFSNCSFVNVFFDKVSAIDLTFTGCRFRGSYLNTTHFGAVKFLSAPISKDEIISNGQLTYFQNCEFDNSTPSDLPGTITFHNKDIQFVNVLFEGCRFKGFVSTDWFKDCTFMDCEFSEQSIEEQLRINNVVN